MLASSWKCLKKANYLFENLKLILLKILIRTPSTKYFTYNLKLDQRRQEKWILDYMVRFICNVCLCFVLKGLDNASERIIIKYKN